MSTLDTLLTQIAQDEMCIETLQTRRSDSLDFHDLPVWQLRAALQAAYEAGLQEGLKLGATPQRPVKATAA